MVTSAVPRYPRRNPDTPAMNPFPFTLHSLVKHPSAPGYAVATDHGPVGVSRDASDLSRPGADYRLASARVRLDERLLFRGPALHENQGIGFILATVNGAAILLCAPEAPPPPRTVLLGSRQENWFGFAPETRIAAEPEPLPLAALTPETCLVSASGNPTRLAALVRREAHLLFHPPPHAAPVIIRQGALGPGLPDHDLTLSPDQALLVEDVFVRAGALVGAPGIHRAPFPDRVLTYLRPELSHEACLVANGLTVLVARAIPAGNDAPPDPAAPITPDLSGPEPLPADATRPAMLDLPQVYSARQLPRHLRQRFRADAPP